MLALMSMWAVRAAQGYTGQEVTCWSSGHVTSIDVDMKRCDLVSNRSGMSTTCGHCTASHSEGLLEHLLQSLRSLRHSQVLCDTRTTSEACHSHKWRS